MIKKPILVCLLSSFLLHLQWNKNCLLYTSYQHHQVIAESLEHKKISLDIIYILAILFYRTVNFFMQAQTPPVNISSRGFAQFTHSSAVLEYSAPPIDGSTQPTIP